MLSKRGVSRSGSAATSRSDDSTARALGGDAMSLVTSTLQPDTQTAGKKKKKKKKTKAEKAMDRLEKKCDEFRRAGPVFDSFVTRLDKWLKKHHKIYAEIFSKVDIDGEGYVTYEEFKAVTRDLMIPCSEVELHTVCLLLDTDEAEEINYEELTAGLERVREREATFTEKEINPRLVETKRVLPHCGQCKMVVWDGEPYRPDVPRYIEILFRLVTFETYKAHPAHFTRIVQSNITGLGLLDLIQEETGILSNQVTLFTDKTLEPDALLAPELALEDQGFHGGRIDEPAELLLYYDYGVEFTDCPILLCDHYFGNKTKY